MISSTKRTTLTLDERRISELRNLAAERGVTMSALVDEFLAEGIRRSRAPERTLFRLPAFDMGEPRINIDNRDQLWDTREPE